MSFQEQCPSPDYYTAVRTFIDSDVDNNIYNTADDYDCGMLADDEQDDGIRRKTSKTKLPEGLYEIIPIEGIIDERTGSTLYSISPVSSKGSIKKESCPTSTSVRIEKTSQLRPPTDRQVFSPSPKKKIPLIQVTSPGGRVYDPSALPQESHAPVPNLNESLKPTRTSYVQSQSTGPHTLYPSAEVYYPKHINSLSISPRQHTINLSTSSHNLENVAHSQAKSCPADSPSMKFSSRTINLDNVPTPPPPPIPKMMKLKSPVKQSTPVDEIQYSLNDRSKPFDDVSPIYFKRTLKLPPDVPQSTFKERSGNKEASEEIDPFDNVSRIAPIYKPGTHEQHEDRARLEDYLNERERDYLEKKHSELPFITPGEYRVCMDEDADTAESSFNDDGIISSEREFFSSEYSESDLEDYVPPITRTKRALIAQLVANTVDKNDTREQRREKRENRRKAIRNFHEMLIKKRKLKAYRRLKRVLDMNLENAEQEAFVLEKLELRDKKLNGPYYYEDIEPEAIKKLHKKRKKAIQKKFEAYALMPRFQGDYKHRIQQDLQNAMMPLRFRTKKEEEPITVVSDTFSDSKQEEKEERSSFYDTTVPESELEFFSSEWSDDGILHPEPISRRRDKRRRLLNRYTILDLDLPYQAKRKYLKRTEIEAQFKNFCFSRKTMKAMARLKTVKIKKFRNPCKEATLLESMEIYDKKLDRDYLYDPKESPIFQDLLEKRRRAINRKYNKYIKDKEYRHKFRDRVYVEMQRISYCPYFEEDKEPETDDEESSFNDSEIPTSEEEFMSSGFEDLQPPVKFRRPITRNRKDLYEFLDKLEISPNDTENIIDYKRRLRFEAIQRFKKRLKDRRKFKAYNRLTNVKQMAIKDKGIIAKELYEMELKDKKLNRGFLYRRKEPDVFKAIRDKRVRAIKRKFTQYIRNREFRNIYEKRIEKQWNEIKIEDPELPEENEKPFFQTYNDIEGIFDKDWTNNRGGSYREWGSRKLERFREAALAGIWPQHRHSAKF